MLRLRDTLIHYKVFLHVIGQTETQRFLGFQSPSLAPGLVLWHAVPRKAWRRKYWKGKDTWKREMSCYRKERRQMRREWESSLPFAEKLSKVTIFYSHHTHTQTKHDIAYGIKADDHRWENCDMSLSYMQNISALSPLHIHSHILSLSPIHTYKHTHTQILIPFNSYILKNWEPYPHMAVLGILK